MDSNPHVLPFIAPEEKMTNESNVCYFNFQSEVTDSKVLRAEFGFYVRKSRASRSRDTLILIYKLIPSASPGGRVTKRLIEQEKITLNLAKTGRWYRYKIDRVVRGWIKYPKTNIGLQVEVFDDDGRSLAITKPLEEDEEPFVSSLLHRYREGPSYTYGLLKSSDGRDVSN